MMEYEEALSYLNSVVGENQKLSIETIARIVDCFPFNLKKINFLLNEKRNLLLLGSGGNEGFLRGLYHNFKKITGIENKKELIEIISNYIPSNSEILNFEIRDFLKTTTNSFDLIEINLYESFVSSTIPSLNENYLYTIEAFHEAYNKLSDNGIFAVTRWAVFPMKEAIKIFFTAIEMLERYEIDFNEKIAFIRSANTVTLCIAKSKINLKKVKDFCDKMGFDIIYCNGINNIKYFKQKENLEFIKSLLFDKTKRENFI